MSEKDHQEVKELIHANFSFALMVKIRSQSKKNNKKIRLPET